MSTSSDSDGGIPRPVVLITRPEEDAADLSAVLEAAGFATLRAPMLTIAPYAVDSTALAADLARAQALLFTSANGVRCFARASGVRNLPALCVGAATAGAARDAGFDRVETAGGDVAALAALAAARCDPAAGTLLHAAGSDAAGDLQGRLETNGFTVAKRALYKAEAATALPDDAAAALATGRVAAVTFFSPRSATSFVRVVETAGLGAACAHVVAACLSPAVADRAAAIAWKRTLVAEGPETPALVAALSDALGGA